MEKGRFVPVAVAFNVHRHRKRCNIHLPESIWQKDWVVHCKPAVQGTLTVLNYLTRYIHRVAITNSRIISADNGKVTFRYPSHLISHQSCPIDQLIPYQARSNITDPPAAHR
jgi:hypothetical protein